MKKVIVLVAVIGLLLKFGVLKNPFESKPEFVSDYGNRVVLYATSWCGYCKKTRALLRDNRISFTEYDIESSSKGRDEYNQLNGDGVPLLIMDGEIIRGYDPRKILKFAKGT